MSKEDRKNAMTAFRSGKANILVSSDLSARGLDIPDVSHVFNLDFPLSKMSTFTDVVEVLEEIKKELLYQ